MGHSAEVTAVIDGDTIEIRAAGGTERVRIIGIDPRDRPRRRR